MISSLVATALAGPPRAEVLAGWAGNASQDYGYATVQSALLRSEAASLQLRATVSRLHASWPEGSEVAELEAQGLAVGPAVVFTPGELSVSLGLGLHGRRSSTWVGDTLRDTEITLDATSTADVFWRPRQRALLYTQLALGAAGPSVWLRAGATAPVTPRDRAVSVWLGVESTSSGSVPTLLTEVGPVAEVPLRPLRASLALRATTPVGDLAHGTFVSGRSAVGVAAYWAY